MFETGLQLLHFDIQIDFGFLDNLDGDPMTFLMPLLPWVKTIIVVTRKELT
jgi:hypothetical protein